MVEQPHVWASSTSTMPKPFLKSGVVGQTKAALALPPRSQISGEAEALANEELYEEVPVDMSLAQLPAVNQFSERKETTTTTTVVHLKCVSPAWLRRVFYLA